MRSVKIHVLLFAAAMIMALPVLAHHGFTGRYDTKAPVYVQGEVTSAVWGYPHAVLEIAVKADRAVPEDLATEFGAGLTSLKKAEAATIELPPVSLFNDLEDRIAVGDSIALVVLRNCDPPNQLRAQWVAPAKGQPVLRNRPLQGEVTGC